MFRPKTCSKSSSTGYDNQSGRDYQSRGVLEKLYVYKAALRSVLAVSQDSHGETSQTLPLLIGCSTCVSVLNMCPDVGALSQLVMSTLDPTAGVTLPQTEEESEPPAQGIKPHCFSACLVQVPV